MLHSHRRPSLSKLAGLLSVGILFTGMAALPSHAQHHGNSPWSTGGGTAGVVRCESIKGRSQECQLDGNARLIRQISGTACVKGQNWDQSRSGVWVSSGCRAEFIGEGRGRSHGRDRGHDKDGEQPGSRRGDTHGLQNSQRIIACDSNDGRRNHCDASVSRNVRLVRQASTSACVEGRSWGWDRRGVWVDGGCRGQFLIN